MKKVLPLLMLLCFTAVWGYGQVKSDTRNPNIAPGYGNEEGGTGESGNLDEQKVRLFIPNAFTPNGDGINDFYYIPNANFSQFEFSVFDRWGNQVYQTNDPFFQWDGRARGKQVPSGIYVFVFKGVSSQNVAVKRSGTISVVR